MIESRLMKRERWKDLSSQDIIPDVRPSPSSLLAVHHPSRSSAFLWRVILPHRAACVATGAVLRGAQGPRIAGHLTGCGGGCMGGSWVLLSAYRVVFWVIIGRCQCCIRAEVCQAKSFNFLLVCFVNDGADGRACLSVESMRASLLTSRSPSFEYGPGQAKIGHITRVIGFLEHHICAF